MFDPGLNRGRRAVSLPVPAANWVVLWLMTLFGLFTTWAQPANEAALWTKVSADAAARPAHARWTNPEKGSYFSLNPAGLRPAAIQSNAIDPTGLESKPFVAEVPMPDGTIEQFRVVESPIMEPDLASRFPELKTFAGQGIDDPTATVRLNESPFGFHAQVLSTRGALYVDPVYHGDTELHVSYFKRDARRPEGFRCLTAPETGLSPILSAESLNAQRTVFGGTLRTFRLALAATGEYTAYFGGTVNNAMAAIVVAINRVNGLFEREFGVRLTLVSNNHLIIYTNPATDPYSNFDEFQMLAQNQANLNTIIRPANYDIGHVFGTGGGGIATLRSVCSSQFKARGVTGLSSPEGDAFYIDFVAHEMGHQFGADHTFNAESGSCAGQRSPDAACEPGSGSTIMGYAGICPPNDVADASDPYFHAWSLSQIRQFLSSISCGTTIATTNHAPIVSVPASVSIPGQTPFVLTAAASDPNGDALTYCWEQINPGGAADNLSDPDWGDNPLFRSFAPTNSPTRHFPRLRSVLENTSSNVERLPSTSRTLTFRVTVRDNVAGGGGVSDGDVHVHVVGTSGPFEVTSPNSPVSWTGQAEVTWNVAGTTANPINATAVNIRLSVDGGQTFPYLLANNVPNDGSHLVTLPDISTETARIRVEAVGNIFYDVSNTDFSIIPSTADIRIVGWDVTQESCEPANGAVDGNELVTVDVTLRNQGGGPATALTATLISTNGVAVVSGTHPFGMMNPGTSATGEFTFVVTGTCGSFVDVLLQLSDGGVNLGIITQRLVLGNLQVETNVFSSLDEILLPDGPAIPYPSTIPVAGIQSTVLSASITLHGFSHSWPADIDAVLVGPGGQSVMLISDAGGNAPVNQATITFVDSGGPVPASGGILSGAYRPTDYVGNDPDSFGSNPPGPFGTTIAPLLTAPNGTWSLYVRDQFTGDSGSVEAWSIRIVTSNLVCCATAPSPQFTSTVFVENEVRLHWDAQPGLQYQVQTRTNLTLGAWMNVGSPVVALSPRAGFTNSATFEPVRFYRVQVLP